MLGFRSYDSIRLLGPSGPSVVSRSQTPKSRNFGDAMILVDSSYDSGKNEVLFVKIGAMVLDLQLDTSFAKGFGPKLP